MEPRELYDEMLKARKEGDNFKVANCAEKIMFKVKDNPFQEGDPRMDLFFNASMAFARWQNGGIDCRRARVQVYEYWAKIADLDKPNPFEEPKTKQPKKVKQEEPMHVLGIIPEKVDLKEELKPDSSKISYNVPDETKEPEGSKKGFFSKRKKR